MSAFAVFDAHQHYGTPFDSMGGLGGLAEMDPDEYGRLELTERLTRMDDRGVDRTVIIAGHGYLRPHGLDDTRRVNDGVVEYLARAPERFAAGVGVAEPLYGAAGLAEVDRCKELGFVGISFHGRFQGVSHDSPWVHRYVERMAEIGLVPFVHAPAGSPEESLWKAEGLAHSFPDVTMLVLDAFSGFEECREVPFVAERCPNLVFDTALAFDFEFVLPTIERCGADRVLFGSDMYSWPSGKYGQRAVAQIVESALSDEDKAAVLGGTLSKILGLEGSEA
jgi:uncharacterized protein